MSSSADAVSNGADRSRRAHHGRRLPGDERGGSQSLLAAIVAPMLLVAAGLVVDGGGQMAATRQAQSVAAEAARAGATAGPASLTDTFAPGSARQGAEDYLRRAGVDGTVSVAGGHVTVHTTVDHDTVFLGLIGIHTMEGHGEASARLIRR